VREIRMLRARWRGLETGPRNTLHGHEGGNPGYGQGHSYGLPRQSSTLPRRFEFVPLWGIAVFFLYAMRRVACTRCGVRVETVPWAQGKHQLTDTYAWFLAGWAKRLP
jgi:hypothetical protein